MAPAIAQPSTTPVELPSTATTIPPKLTENVKEPSRPTRPARPAVRRPRPATTQVASNEAPGVSAIGQLSSGDAIDLRRQTDDGIAATERGLNGITRSLSSSEQATAGHIREFLKQAKAALQAGDVAGAHTLAAKAKVLLSELTAQ